MGGQEKIDAIGTVYLRHLAAIGTHTLHGSEKLFIFLRRKVSIGEIVFGAELRLPERPIFQLFELCFG